MFEKLFARIRGEKSTPQPLTPCQEALRRFEASPFHGDAVFQSIREIDTVRPNILAYIKLLEQVHQSLKEDLPLRIQLPDQCHHLRLADFYISEVGHYLTPSYYSERFFELCCQCLRVYDERSEQAEKTATLQHTLYTSTPIINNLLWLSEHFL